MIWDASIRAVLFDVDGTLLDTTEFIYGGFDHTLAAHGYPVPARSSYAPVVGPPLRQGYELLAPGCDADRLCETHRAWQSANLHVSRPYADAEPVLRALHGAGLRLAAITNRSRITSVDTIARAGLSRYLDLVLSAEDVSNIKPHPEPLLRALTTLGARATEAVMVGDTPVDIEAARAAGVGAVGVSYGFHGPALAGARPDALIHSLRDLPALLGVTM